MRIWHVLAFISVGSTAFAERLAPALTANDVHAVLKPVAGEIEHCYLDRTPEVRGAGQLDLVLTVSRRGELERVDVKTPGLSARVGKEIAGCIRTAVAPVSFPARRTFTTATVPYFFQRTATPNGGPQLSCWNPNGCHAN
jgi:hypothetical protein